MNFETTVVEYDDDNHFIPLDNTLLADLGLTTGDKLEVTLETTPESEASIKARVITDDGSI
jgi:hypothetical protein